MEEEVKRKSFVFYGTYNDVMRKLPPEDELIYIHTICDYYFNGTPIPESTGSFVVDIALASIKEVMAANDSRYRNAMKGGAPKGNRNAQKQPKTTENNQKQPNLNSVELQNNQKQPMVDLENNQKTTRLNYKTTDKTTHCFSKQPNDNVNDNVNDNDNVNEVGCFSKSKTDVKEVGDFEFETWSYDDWQKIGLDVLIDNDFTINQFIKDMEPYSCAGVYSLPSYYPTGLKKKIEAEVSKVYPSTKLQY